MNLEITSDMNQFCIIIGFYIITSMVLYYCKYNSKYDSILL